MNIQLIINNLKKSNLKGLQIEKHSGVLTSTWLIYKQKERFYYFDINQKIEFIKEYCYTEKELLTEFTNANYIIEEVIS
jgi:hypothetical protein